MKAQISLGIRLVCFESSLGALWVAKDPQLLHADREESRRQGRSEVSLSAHLILLILCFASNMNQFDTSLPAIAGDVSIAIIR